MAERDVPASTAPGDRACPWCGAPNPPRAERCASCGSWLVSNTHPAENGELVIDVSGAEPQIVEPGEPQPPWFSSARYTAGRGMVIQGPGACLLASAAVLLFVCGQCVLAYYFLRWIF